MTAAMTIPCSTREGLIDLADTDQVSEALFTPHALATGLASIFRYGGRAPRPWTVAAHSVIVSRLCESPVEKAWALLHDAHEVVLGDATRPSVRLIEHVAGDTGFSDRLKAVAHALDRVIAGQWGLTDSLTPDVMAAVKRQDVLAGIAERVCLFREPHVGNDELDEARQAIHAIANSGLRMTYDGALDAKGMWLREASTLARQGVWQLPS